MTWFSTKAWDIKVPQSQQQKLMNSYGQKRVKVKGVERTGWVHFWGAYNWDTAGSFMVWFQKISMPTLSMVIEGNSKGGW